jgi:hypothetical protein
MTKKPHNINMNQFNLPRFIVKFVNNSLSGFNRGSQAQGQGPAFENPSLQHLETTQNLKNLTQHLIKESIAGNKQFNPTNRALLMQDLKMNNLESFQQSIYIKDIMKLPPEMESVLLILQKNMATSKDTAKLLAENINLSQLSELLQTSGKEAMNKLILAMSNASKQGITDLSQIKDAMKFINASVSVAGQDNAAQILKTFMLLYLPWLPLQEGVDFDLEIETSENESGEEELSITIVISTRNYGNVRVTLIMIEGTSIDIMITCSKEFPKEELLKRINTESQSHSIQTNVMVEEKIIKRDEETPRQAKISMTNLPKINPFLLLMANAIIRHTIDLDNQKVNGE